MGKPTGRHMEKKHRPGRKLPLVFALAAAVLLGAVIWGVAAKYTQESSGSAVVRAREFYFTSDLLTESASTVYYLNPGTESVSFTLSRMEDGLRNAEGETVSWKVTTNGGTLSASTGTLTEENYTQTVTLSGLSDGGTYTVTAVGSAGYQKTLSATFAVQTSPTGFYKYVDNTDPACVLLTVWTENCSGMVTVTFPDGLIPDATDEDLDGGPNNYNNGTYSSDTLTQEYGEYHSHTYRFFKQNGSAAYAATNFSVKLNDTEATVKTPE